MLCKFERAVRVSERLQFGPIQPAALRVAHRRLRRGRRKIDRPQWAMSGFR